MAGVGYGCAVKGGDADAHGDGEWGLFKMERLIGDKRAEFFGAFFCVFYCRWRDKYYVGKIKAVGLK
ncbi:MAG: hypothetical protein ACI8V2_001257 [Candidatus Latescibacterota bacterium]